MSITCPNCNTSFIVSNDQIGTLGRKVKCSKCQHIWYQKFDLPTPSITSENTESNQNDVATNNIRIPSSEDNKIAINSLDNLIYSNHNATLSPLLPSNGTSPINIISILLINLIFLLLFILFYEKFSLLALPKIEGKKVIIENIYTKQGTINNQLKISYRLTNLDNRNILIPLTRVRILDKQHLPVKSYILDQQNIKLLPKQHIDITTTLENIPVTGSSIDIMVGNSLDFILQ